MTEQSDLYDDRNNPHAQRLLRILERFAVTCEKRAGKDSGRILDRGRTLDGRILQQKPERFVEEELIEPIATDVLGWDIRFQPKGFDGLEGRIPDFTILNMNVENFGEIKRPRKVDEAIPDSVEYIKSAVERPLVGVATDGFSWVLHTAGEGETPRSRNHERIYSIFRKIRMEEVHRKAARKRRSVLREEASDFVETFHIDRLRDDIPEE